MSLGLVLLLSLWEISCTWYKSYQCLLLSLCLLRKKCSKLISKTRKFVFLMIRSQGKKKTMAMTSRQGSSARQQQMEKVVEEYGNIFTSPKRVSLHCQVKHPIDLTLGAPLPNGPIYRHSVLEWWNHEADSGAAAERSHPAKFIALWELDRVGTEEGWDLETMYLLSGAEKYHCLE